ncbi:MAG: tRNA pseudouridine(55) synthase TruB [Flavobacteriaceae bacterium]|nr:tRNA pseudouridine(55) synthase TruB [Flavobacteriaceae bacterium]|tara:strand:- start:237202 stop:237891 length:690 start_codon:yes stop_codon:yes gene_type:complete
MTKEEFLEGKVLLIDKPLEWTSFQAVNKIRWHIKKQFGLKKIKVGHAGTLDPLATGLLIICTGKKTKSINEYQAQEKEYTGSIYLGATTPSYDLETEVNQIFETSHITSELIYETTIKFVGEIDQKPPIYSAIKKDGKRLYDIARKGETTEIKSRKVNITSFEITKIEMPLVEFRVSCSKGTYIRSLANDFGEALNSGAYLASLRRTKIGDFSVTDGLSIDDFIDQLKA